MILQLLLRDLSGEEEKCTLEISDSGNPSIVLKTSGSSTKKFGGDDFFQCLVDLRLHLEAVNKFILCKGSRVDIYPSGMTREMSSGRLAYINKIGHVSNKSDIVDIFEPSSFESIGTVKEQETFHKKWIDSIRSKPK